VVTRPLPSVLARVVCAVVGAEHMARGDQSPAAIPAGAPARDADNPGEGVRFCSPATVDPVDPVLGKVCLAAALAAQVLETPGRP
jgi:hypothetical protein